MAHPKIIVAEDEPVSRAVLKNMLLELGYPAFFSPDGEHAYHTLKLNPEFDILLTDIKMPELSGQELVKMVREELGHLQMPAILMSSYIKLSEIKDIVNKSDTFFLAKPIHPKDLKHNLELCEDFLSSRNP